MKKKKKSKKTKTFGASVVGLIALTIIALAFCGVGAFPRSGGGTTMSVTNEAGNTLTPFNTSIGTTTAVLVFTKSSNRLDRIFRICNDQDTTYRLLLSTSSTMAGTFTQSTVAYDMVLPNSCNEYVAPPQSIYAVFRASATGGSFTGGRAFGWKRFDSRD